MKKFYSIVIVAILILSNTITYASKPSSWALSGVEELKSYGQFGEGIFGNYNKNITRGEFIYLAVKLYELFDGKEIIADQNIKFSDTNNVYAIKGATAGITTGIGSQKFGFDMPITREQLSTLLINILLKGNVSLKEDSDFKFDDDSKISSWAKKNVYIAKANSIIQGVGDNKFNPQGFTTVEQALTILNNIIQETDGKTWIASDRDTEIKIAITPDKNRYHVITKDEPGYVEGFHFNGKYFPYSYWKAEDEESSLSYYREYLLYDIEERKSQDRLETVILEAENMIEQYKGELVKYSPNSYEYKRRVVWINETLPQQIESLKEKLVDDMTYMDEERYYDELTYKYITSSITQKYPIITEGSLDQITTQQEKQLVELVGWFAHHTFYDINGAFGTNYEVPKNSLYMSYLRSARSYDDANKIIPELVSKKESEFCKGLLPYIDKASKDGTFFGVCGDYAQLFNRVARQMGIDSIIIDCFSERHSWNMVRLADGSIYQFDVTGVDAHEWPNMFRTSKGMSSGSQIHKYTEIIDNKEFSEVRLKKFFNLGTGDNESSEYPSENQNFISGRKMPSDLLKNYFDYYKENFPIRSFYDLNGNLLDKYK